MRADQSAAPVPVIRHLAGPLIGLGLVIWLLWAAAIANPTLHSGPVPTWPQGTPLGHQVTLPP